jgi:hypothetical protein
MAQHCSLSERVCGTTGLRSSLWKNRASECDRSVEHRRSQEEFWDVLILIEARDLYFLCVVLKSSVNVVLVEAPSYKYPMPDGQPGTRFTVLTCDHNLRAYSQGLREVSIGNQSYKFNLIRKLSNAIEWCSMSVAEEIGSSPDTNHCESSNRRHRSMYRQDRVYPSQLVLTSRCI